MPRPAPELSDVLEALKDDVFDASMFTALAVPSTAHPYGRRVLFATDSVEGMVASWTRGVSCAPHDHGGSAGGVRVLQGEAIHRIWKVCGGALTLVLEERKGTGKVISCGPNLVHSMMDGGGAEPLVTLHLYTGPIDHMVVYDQVGGRTIVVDGASGAWVPHDAPDHLRAIMPGFLPSDEARRFASV